MGDILPSVVSSLIMFFLVFLINFCEVSDMLKIILQCTSGILIYTVTSALVNNQMVKGIWSLILHRLKNFKPNEDVHF